MDNPTTTQYANLMHNFILKAQSTVREIDPQNDLTFLRIRSKKNEIMLAKSYLLKFPVQPEVKQLASQASQLLRSDTSEGNPGWVLQRSQKLQPGLTQAADQGVSAARLLSAGQLSSWARAPGLPLATAQEGQREQWGFLVSTCPGFQMRD
ncbi:Dynein light chain roadblock-type 1 [Tupaia chinensis]|uniref:Dynein light chain roadblock-type 1 n=1 Tax=Tupaia chinensis TaxID=246437 RepID=L9L158_TUPCH|nr:Dynein light chain roadblock-type 1 [Tupaia chinensis]